MKFLLLVACFLLTFPIQAGTTDSSVPDKKYIEHGSKFPSVVGIEVITKPKNEDKTSLSLGSAVVISPNWIITAAHVVNNHQSSRIVVNNKTTIDLDKIIIHEDFYNKKFGAADIALGRSKTKIEMESYPELYNTDDEIHKEVSIVGYGFTARIADRIKEYRFDKEKRGGTNIIEDVYDNLLICKLSKKDKTNLEFLICSGDSGGGLFIDNKLAGVNSCVLTEDEKPDSGYGDESGHTRISVFHQWIIDNIKDDSRK